MQNKELNYQGKRIVYRTTGKGPAVILLHGFGEEGSVWKQQYDIFPGQQLIVPDLPGSGLSEAIDDMSMEGLADAVKALIDQELGSEAKLILIGHSMGGYITLAFAERYPERLRSFGLFHSTAFADSDEKKETRRKGIRFIEEHGAAEFLKTATPNLYAPASREHHPEWIEEHFNTVRNFSAGSLVSYYTAMIQRPDRTAVLQTSKVPVLFVLGRHDTAVPLQDGWKQCYLPQISYIQILEQAGHMGMREETEKANQILVQFVNATENIAET
ncbi:MAG TPA: alpha/beta hydrolase [Flavisolibacter sp.]|nr:alpha/beta hydrolase [Flavisolibacter sp.]